VDLVELPAGELRRVGGGGDQQPCLTVDGRWPEIFDDPSIVAVTFVTCVGT
jgi:hypothetical protein